MSCRRGVGFGDSTSDLRSAKQAHARSIPCRRAQVEGVRMCAHRAARPAPGGSPQRGGQGSGGPRPPPFRPLAPPGVTVMYPRGTPPGPPFRPRRGRGEGARRLDSAMTDPTCPACRLASGAESPPGGIVLREAGLLLHALLGPSPLPGWLVLTSEVHVRAWPDLPAGPLAALGPLAARVMRAQRDVLGAEHVYAFA